MNDSVGWGLNSRDWYPAGRHWATFLLAALWLLGTGAAYAYQNNMACGNWTVGGINLGCAGPTSMPNQVNGVTWPGWAVLSITPGADVKFEGKSTGDGGTGAASPPVETTGNLGLWGSDKVDATGDARINGSVFFTNGTYGAPAAAFGGGITAGSPGSWTRIAAGNGFRSDFATTTLLWNARLDALAAAAGAGGLAGTLPLANIVNSDGTPAGAAFASLASDVSLSQNITIKASQGGTNVIQFGRNLDLKNYTLTLDANGFTDVDFVLNIGNDLKGSDWSGLALNGVAWHDVLINVKHNLDVDSFAVSPAGDNRYSGILLAGNDIKLKRTQWTGQLIGGNNFELTEGSQVTNPGGLISVLTFVPQPGTLWLLLAAALGLALRAACRSPRPGALRPA